MQEKSQKGRFRSFSQKQYFIGDTDFSAPSCNQQTHFQRSGSTFAPRIQKRLFFMHLIS